MSKKLLKAAVIGTGHIARQHLGCLHKMQQSENGGGGGVQIVGVCDLSPALAESTAERFGGPAFFTNYQEMLEQTRPDVVHVTTPPQSHYQLALDSLAAKAHVIVEKPLAVDFAQVDKLLTAAAASGRDLFEDYNYLYNAPVAKLRAQLASGELGSVVQVEVMICLDILGKDSRFADPNIPHPCLKLPGGAVADFLTHFAYLAHAFAGPLKHAEAVQCLWSKRTANSPLPADEFRALIDGTIAPAVLSFSAHSQPDVFWLHVYTTKARVSINLFEGRMTVDRLRNIPRPLIPLVNGFSEARAIRRSAVGSLWRKLSGGPGAYEGLWNLLEQAYTAWANPTEKLPGTPLITLPQIREVNEILAALAATAPPVITNPHLASKPFATSMIAPGGGDK